MNETKLVIFDMDGTLYKFDSSGSDGAIYQTKFYDEVRRRGIEFLAQRLSISIEEATAIRERIFKEYSGDVSTALEKGYGIPKAEYFGYVWNIDASKYIQGDPELREVLLGVKCKRALLTTAPEIWAHAALKSIGVDGLFDKMWFGDGDIRKPDKRAYLQIVDYFGIAPENIVIVEDEPKFLAPAKALGMTTVLVGAKKPEHNGIDHYVQRVHDIKHIIKLKSRST